mmetsp:Transcript_49406/g.137321  ORF Transcript_49406/g.137321 Transcript_49406/m.137321 type:complete len:219 (-) Transcript_49406:1009-1665(-)
MASSSFRAAWVTRASSACRAASAERSSARRSASRHRRLAFAARASAVALAATASACALSTAPRRLTTCACNACTAPCSSCWPSSTRPAALRPSLCSDVAMCMSSATFQRVAVPERQRTWLVGSSRASMTCSTNCLLFISASLVPVSSSNLSLRSKRASFTSSKSPSDVSLSNCNRRTIPSSAKVFCISAMDTSPLLSLSTISKSRLSMHRCSRLIWRL